MCITVCGKFGSNEGGVVGYVDRMRAQFPAKWGVQMAGMNFQTRSRFRPYYIRNYHKSQVKKLRGAPSREL